MNVHHLRSHIVQGTSSCDWALAGGIYGQAKVCQLNALVCHEQNVLRLDVSVNDALQPLSCTEAEQVKSPMQGIHTFLITEPATLCLCCLRFRSCQLKLRSRAVVLHKNVSERNLKQDYLRMTLRTCGNARHCVFSPVTRCRPRTKAPPVVVLHSVSSRVVFVAYCNLIVCALSPCASPSLCTFLTGFQALP